MQSIYQYTLNDLIESFQSIGLKKFRADQVYQWIYKKDIIDFDSMTNLSLDLRNQLKEYYDTSLLDIEDLQISSDGTRKYLLKLEDGYIETVLMIHPYGKSLCVTSQLGCNMGCSFCASGLLKKQRDLTVDEMVRQVLTVNHDIHEHVSHVVVMGTGEPFDNYNVLTKFLNVINDPKGLEIGARHITVSTCGLVDKIREYAHFPLQTNLAISLHASNDDIRNQLMPINKKYNLDALRDAIKYYIDVTNRRVTLEYILLDGINDDLKYARQLAHYLKGLNVYVNLIPYNSVDENGYKQSKNIQSFKDELLKLHINTTLRKEHGTDIDGACGQLRAKKEGVI